MTRHTYIHTHSLMCSSYSLLPSARRISHQVTNRAPEHSTPWRTPHSAIVLDVINALPVERVLMQKAKEISSLADLIDAMRQTKSDCIDLCDMGQFVTSALQATAYNSVAWTDKLVSRRMCNSPKMATKGMPSGLENEWIFQLEWSLTTNPMVHCLGEDFW